MRRFCKKYALYGTLMGALTVLFILLPGMEVFLSGDAAKIILFLIVLGVVFLLICIYYILFVYTSSYKLDDVSINCKRGVLFKKNSTLDYDKMHAINKRQNIIHKLFHIAILTVDSGSTNTAHQGEIIIIEDETVIDEILESLKCKQMSKEINNDVIENTELVSGLNKGEKLYSFTSKWKIFYAFFNTIWILIIATLVFIGLIVIYQAIDVPIDASERTPFGEFLAIVAAITYGIVLFVFIVNLISSLVEYYDFRISKDGEDIEVVYGLIVRNHNTLDLKRIKAIKVRQGLLKRIFGFASVDVEVIGYMEKQNSGIFQGILVPLCRMSEVNEILNSILPDYIPLEKSEKSKKISPYLCWSFFFLTVTTGVVIAFSMIFMMMINVEKIMIIYFLLSVLAAYLFIGLLIIFDSVLEYKTSSINICDDKVTFYHGGFIKRVVVIKKKNLIAIEDITTPFRRKKDIFSYKIHFVGNNFTNTLVVKCLDKKLISELNQLIRL